MTKIKPFFKLVVVGLPLASILGASLLPLHNAGRHLLVFFTLLWFMIFILFNSPGK